MGQNFVSLELKNYVEKEVAIKMLNIARAVYDNGKVRFIDRVPKGRFEVIVTFPDKKEEREDFNSVAFGIWKGRSETKDSVMWVKKLRKRWGLRKSE
ncbi:MAG: hypothetical protein V2A53_01070 [bacterium]